MSFSQQSAAPSTSSSLDGRVNRWRQAEPLPWANGPFRLAPTWVSDRFNDAWTNGKTTGQAYCSIVGSICHGPIDHALYIMRDGECVTNLFVSRPADPQDPHYWYVDFEFGGSENGVPHNQGRLYWGREDQPVDDWLVATSGQDHPPRRGVAYVIFKRLWCGQIQANSKARPAIPNIEVCGARLITPTVPGAMRLPSTFDSPFGAGVNLVAGLYDLITHPRAGIDAGALLDTASWQAAAIGLETGTKKSAGISGAAAYIAPVHASQVDAERLIGDYLSYCDGWLPIRNGRIGIDWYPNDGAIPASLPEISDHDLVRDSDETVDIGTYADLPTLIVGSGLDVFSYLGESVATASVPLVRAITRRNNPEKVDRPWIVDVDYLQAHVEALASLSIVLPASGEITVRRDRAVRLDGSPLLPGDLFELTLTRHSFSSVCRVLERQEDDKGADVEIKWCRERGTNGLVYAPPTDPRERYILADPAVLGPDDWAVVETPPFTADFAAVILCRRLQPTLSGATIALDDDGVWTTGSCTLGAQGFAVRVTIEADDGITLSVFSDDPTASSDLGSGVTASEQADDTLYLVCGDEWMSIGAVTSAGSDRYSVAVLRGRQGSPSATHAVGSYGWVVRRANLTQWSHALFTSLATRYFKISTYHTLAESAYSAPKSLTFRVGSGRRVVLYCYARPPLGGVPPNPEEWYATFVGPLPAYRERGFLSGLASNYTPWSESPPAPNIGGLLDVLTTEIFIGNGPAFGPPAMWTCSCGVMANGAITAGSYSPVTQSSPVTTSKAQLNEAGNRLADLRPINDADGWSAPIYYSATGKTQLRRNATSGKMEETPDGGTTVQAMGGGGFPAGAVDGQMIVADSSQPEKVRWTGVSVLPAPEVAAVLVSNGSAWYSMAGSQPGQALVLNQSLVPVWATVDSIVFDPNSGQPQLQGTTVQCTWSFNGDGNGILYMLGSNIRRQAWSNPRTYGAQLAMLSSPAGAEAFYTGLMDRALGANQISQAGSVWLTIDLGFIRQAAVESYSMQGGSAGYYPRTFRWQGSNNVVAMTPTDINAATWVDIDVRTADTTINAPSAWGHFVSNGDSTTRFRFLRLVVTADSSASANPYLNCQEIELYGPCTIITQNLPVGTTALTLASPGDGEGLFYFYGSIARSKPWSNPLNCGLIQYITDALTSTTPAPMGYIPMLANRVSLGTEDAYLQWPSATTGSLVFDFGPNKAIAVTNYTLKTTTTSQYPRGWILEGTNSLPGWTMMDINSWGGWVAIDTHASDATINATGTWYTFSCNGNTTTRFRYVRWRNTQNGSAGAYFRMFEMEFYGSLEVT